MRNKVQDLYSDLSFGLDITNTGEVSIVKNERAINQSIKSILSTRRGERMMFPEFGSLLPDLLFEPVDDITSGIIANDIVSAITKWEPRISIKTIFVAPLPDRNAYDVDIEYTILSLNYQGSFSEKIFSENSF